MRAKWHQLKSHFMVYNCVLLITFIRVNMSISQVHNSAHTYHKIDAMDDGRDEIYAIAIGRTRDANINALLFVLSYHLFNPFILFH